MNWTEGRLKGFIQSALRKAFSRYPAKYECLKEASVGKKLNKASGRMAYHYKCSSCKKDFPLVDLQVDHIEPVVAVADGFVDWNTYVDRLFCSGDKLQVLCKKCHVKKSTLENKGRKRKK